MWAVAAGVWADEEKPGGGEMTAWDGGQGLPLSCRLSGTARIIIYLF